MILIDLLVVLAMIALLVMLACALVNVLVFPRLRPPPANAAPPLIHPSADTPLVSVLISARDDANSIGATVHSLRAQTYTRFEVVLLDDQSADGTLGIAQAALAGDSRFRVVEGQPLLESWRREPWARHQLAHLANGSVLVFADSAVQWQPDALKALVAAFRQSDADLLNVYPTQIVATRAERLLVPLAGMALLAVPMPFAPATSAQCLVFRKSAYQAISGHVAVRNSAVEGVIFARLIKAKGLRLRLADGAGLLTCRASRNDRDLRNRFAGGILTLCRNRRGVLLLATLAQLGLFALPVLWLLLGWLTPQIGGYPLAPLALVALGLAVRAVTAQITPQPLSDALWLPVASLLLASIAVQAAVRRDPKKG